MIKVLSIAGSDCSGGAGIQADIKTITAHGMYAMSVITALTAQNTTGVYGVQEVTPGFVAQQLDCVFQDIVPDAVKVGMVSSVGIIQVIVDKLHEYGASHVVVDPVMVSTSGNRLLNTDAMEAVQQLLLPIAEIITPNIPEAEALTGLHIESREQMIIAAERISNVFPGAILIKGGHLVSSADDLLFIEGQPIWLPGKRVDNPNTHGTGCTLSSAIACGLARGMGMVASVTEAKNYVTNALRAGLDLGKGSGPLNHCFGLKSGMPG